MDIDLRHRLAILPASPHTLPDAEQLARRWGVACLPPGSDPVDLEEPPLVFCLGEGGCRLQQTGPKVPGPVLVDFLAGAVAHRRRFGGGAGQQIAKAVGLKGGRRPSVADLTAGLGRDGFVLATLGCELTLVERSPVVAALLADGLARARGDAEVGPIVARMHLVEGQASSWLESQTPDSEACPDVIYLDPMFPHSDKSAQVKKEMRLFRDLVGDDADAGALLEKALGVARHRVVVKRPRKAPSLEGPAPGYRLEGKSGRFDIYPLRAFD